MAKNTEVTETVTPLLPLEEILAVLEEYRNQGRLDVIEPVNDMTYIWKVELKKRAAISAQQQELPFPADESKDL